MAIVDQKLLIDYVKMGQDHWEKYKKKKVSLNYFGEPLIRMAFSNVHPGMDKGALTGVKGCLRDMIINLEWWEGIWIIPLSKSNYRLRATYFPDHLELLLASLIATTIRYRNDLNERHTGLSQIVAGFFTLGFEWSCDASYRGFDLIKRPEMIRLEVRPAERIAIEA